MRVTSPLVEYLSMSWNEKVCMFLYMALLRLAAKPVEAYADTRPAMMPKKSERKAMPTIISPYL